jgi:putative flippase GtrA
MAGAVTSILLWVLSEYAGVVLPPEVAAAVTTVISFATSYLTSND